MEEVQDYDGHLASRGLLESLPLVKLHFNLRLVLSLVGEEDLLLEVWDSYLVRVFLRRRYGYIGRLSESRHDTCLLFSLIFFRPATPTALFFFTTYC